MTSHLIPESSQSAKRCFKRSSQQRCGIHEGHSYDSYEDVRLACDRKLAEWEHQGITPPWQPMANNNWLFTR
ncbi:MAG: hypothetical protein ACFUZC_03470 [Chthoniobacteraceae bacterium]